jgi:acetylornithine/succinyldiaminopimelate/putrescine aminotransferase
LRIRDELDLDARVRERSAQLFEGLADLARSRPEILGEPRGMGLLIGLTVQAPYDSGAIVAAARECGLLIGSAGGNSVRFAPPLIISEEEVSRAVSLLGMSFDCAQDDGSGRQTLAPARSAVPSEARSAESKGRNDRSG